MREHDALFRFFIPFRREPRLERISKSAIFEVEGNFTDRRANGHARCLAASSVENRMSRLTTTIIMFMLASAAQAGGYSGYNDPYGDPYSGSHGPYSGYRDRSSIYQDPYSVYQDPASIYQDPASVYQDPASVYQNPYSDVYIPRNR